MGLPDLICKNKIIRNGNFRSMVFRRTHVRFCTFLGTNMAYVKILEGGTWAGDGWESCNLFRLTMERVTVEMEEFKWCSMGNTRFAEVRLEAVRFQRCALQGSLWTGTELTGCVFQDCNFRGMRFAGGKMERVKFRNCIFDETDLYDVSMRKVYFQNCRFCGGRVPQGPGCSFQNCDLENI